MKFQHFIYFITCLFMTGCANIVAPTGGPKDEKAPQFLNRHNADSLLKFQGGKIVLEFDEYIKLQNLQNQLLISPLMKQNPKIEIRKKNLIVDIADTLLEPNTTYHIELGNSIRDIREGNEFKDLHIVFSTGAYFDTLSLKGMVINASTGLPDTSSWVFLYPGGIPDSIIKTTRPLYVTKTSNGSFSFNGLPDRTFNLYAVGDKNSNYRYDAAGEQIGFLEHSVSPRTEKEDILIYTFQENDTLGKSIENDNSGSLRKGASATPLTYQLNIKKTEERSFDFLKPIEITFNRKVDSVFFNKIRLYEEDALDLEAIPKLDSSGKRISIYSSASNHRWKENTHYRLELWEAFARDTSTVRLKADTVRFVTYKESDYGDIIVELEQEKVKASNYLLLYEGDSVLKRSRITDTIMRFTGLPPSNYSIKILQDNNQNGKWDNGDFKMRKEPEIMISIAQNILLKKGFTQKITGGRKAKPKE